MSPEAFDRLANGWDRLHGAIQRMQTALPSQMTDADAKLESERLTFRDLIRDMAKEIQNSA